MTGPDLSPPAAAALAENAAAAQIPNDPPDAAKTSCAAARPPYTDRETRILMSFAMKSGGHLLSQWLRNKLMLSLGYFSANSIYLDTVASREERTSHGMKMPRWFRLPGVTYVAPDTRNVESEGFTTIGAMNSRWNAHYTRAMKQADVMLFLLTPEYLASQWCMLEWKQYQDEQARRAEKGLPPIQGLVVGFGSEEETAQFAGGKADTLTVSRIETAGGHPTALGPEGKGTAIDDAAYGQILSWVTAHGA